MKTAIEGAASVAWISSRVESLISLVSSGQNITLNLGETPSSNGTNAVANTVAGLKDLLLRYGIGRNCTLTSHFEIVDEVCLNAEEIGDADFFSISCSNKVRNFSGIGLNVRQLNIKSWNVSLKKCCVADLSIDLSELRESVTISNCEIGRLRLINNGGVYANILISEAKVSELQLGADFNPREIWVENTAFVCEPLLPVRVQNIRLDAASILPRLNRASFSILHSWAEKRGNSEIAHIARGRELALQKAHSKGGERLVLTLWEIFSDFGNSFWRPLIWIAALIVIFVLLLSATGTVAGFECGDDCGWRSVLTGDDFSSCLWRSLVGALEGIFSPFSIFSQRSLVIPISPWVAGLKILYNYLCLGLVFLFGFAVRRRFKMH